MFGFLILIIRYFNLRLNFSVFSLVLVLMEGSIELDYDLVEIENWSRKRSYKLEGIGAE